MKHARVSNHKAGLSFTLSFLLFALVGLLIGGFLVAKVDRALDRGEPPVSPTVASETPLIFRSPDPDKFKVDFSG